MPRVRGASRGSPMSRAGSRSRHEPGLYSASISTPLMVLNRVCRWGARRGASASVRSRRRRSRSRPASLMAATLSSPLMVPGSLLRLAPPPPRPRVTAGGCAGLPPPPTPAPAAPCAGADEQRAPGFYPDLEALLPTEVAGASPATRDSGRYCSAKTLGSLLETGIAALRFAGAAWPGEGEAGIELGASAAPGLTVDAV